MKGPYQRLKYDLRRLWECPQCKRRERTAGTATFRHCQCQLNKVDGKAVVMKLIEDGVQRIVPPVRLQHEPSPSSPVEGAADQLSPEPSEQALGNAGPEISPPAF